MKQQKEIQEINKSLVFHKNETILSCYEHFSARHKMRLGGKLSFEKYWENWILSLRGELVKDDGKRMVRAIGHYIKDPIMYKIVYIKIKKLNIYIPLTIYEIADHKRKYRMYRNILRNKKHNERR